MEQNKIISKCESPWNLPLVCVKKRDKDEIRICRDYRALNEITESPIFQIPNTEEMLDILQGAKYFTSLDLGNSFNQVEKMHCKILIGCHLELHQPQQNFRI